MRPAPVRLEDRADWPALREEAARIDPSLTSRQLDVVGLAVPAEERATGALVARLAAAMTAGAVEMPPASAPPASAPRRPFDGRPLLTRSDWPELRAGALRMAPDHTEAIAWVGRLEGLVLHAVPDDTFVAEAARAYRRLQARLQAREAEGC